MALTDQVERPTGRTTVAGRCDLAALTFVAHKSNVALLGPPGVGKTHCETLSAIPQS